jgi:Asp-tRNA(Asn)/Glu-tRNA(Gln) amidotransferase B subunit
LTTDTCPIRILLQWYLEMYEHNVFVLILLLTHLKDLISHLQVSMPKLPDTMVAMLTEEYGLSTKDAGTLLSLDDGHRLDYFFDVVARLQESALEEVNRAYIGRVVGNWYVINSSSKSHSLIDQTQGPDGTR